MITGPRKRAELSKPSSSKPAGIVKPKPLRPFQRPTILDTTDEDIPEMDLNAPSVNIGPPATSAGRPSTARRFKQRESSATTFTFTGERATGVDVQELYASSEDITRRLGSRSRTRRLSPLRQSSPASSQRPVNPLARTRTSIFQPKEAKVEYALLLSGDSLVSTHACKRWVSAISLSLLNPQLTLGRPGNTSANMAPRPSAGLGVAICRSLSATLL